MERRITIWERDPVVAEDIAETVASTLTDADVAQVVSLEEAAARVGGRAAGSAIAILHGTRDELCDRRLLAALSAARTRVIAIHRPLPCAAARDWIFLPPPFTDEALRTALGRALATEA